MVTIVTNTPAINFAVNYLQTNPKAKPEQLQVELRNHLQELRKKGVKISKGEIAQANAQIEEIYKAASEQLKANLKAKVTPQTKNAVSSVNSAHAAAVYPKYNDHLKTDHHYFDYNSMSKKARHNLHKKNNVRCKVCIWR